MSIPIAQAFSAGMVATINPCGFATLPAYMAYHMGLMATGSYLVYYWTLGSGGKLLFA